MNYRIAVIPGDGIGPEVVAEGIKVLNAVAGPAGIKFDYTYYDLGGERYQRTGETLPDSVVAELRQFNAIYLGAIGHPEVAPGILERASSSNCALSWINISTCVQWCFIPGWKHP